MPGPGPGRRLASGGAIDRTRTLGFTFDGREYAGLEGDTLASALLANGLAGGFQSPLLGRPRGVMSAGPEEPCAFVERWYHVHGCRRWFHLVRDTATNELLAEGR